MSEGTNRRLCGGGLCPRDRPAQPLRRCHGSWRRNSKNGWLCVETSGRPAARRRAPAGEASRFLTEPRDGLEHLKSRSLAPVTGSRIHSFTGSCRLIDGGSWSRSWCGILREQLVDERATEVQSLLPLPMRILPLVNSPLSDRTSRAQYRRGP
jgi:hypothetical protein